MQTNYHTSPYGLSLLCTSLIMMCTLLGNSQNTIFVNSIDDNDDGSCNSEHCSLREAINEANEDGVESIIQFKFKAGNTPFIITMDTDLPPITEANTTIDVIADHQPGEVVLVGDKSSPGHYGLIISTHLVNVYGLSITKWDRAGILIDGFSSDIQDIKIGNPAGPNYLFNNDKGIWINTGTDKTIKDLTIQANYIGTSNQMASTLGNECCGIQTTGGGSYERVLIGGDPNLNEGNKIVYNKGYGISPPSHAVVRGNYIGVDPSGFVNMANESHGILMASTDMYILQNAIYYNKGFGVFENCGSCTRNRISLNTIHCNDLGGISSSYPKPVIQSVAPIVTGTAMPYDTVELFRNQGYCVDCQAKTYVGTAITDATGQWSIDLGFSYSGKFSATACNAGGNTSSLSTCTNDDDCQSAPFLSYSEGGCVSDYHFSSLLSATPSGTPVATCYSPNNLNPLDIWFKAVVPSTGALMLHLDTVNTQIDPIIEIYTGSCGALVLERCDSLTRYPYVFPVAGLAPESQVIFRLMDQGNDDNGIVGIAMTELPADSSRWQICEDKYDNRVANEFIVQYDPGTSPADVQAVVDELIMEGGELVKSCDCSEQVLQLWKESTPIELEDRRTVAKGKANVDTTGYNFIIDERYCITESQSTQVNIIDGPNGPIFITELITTNDTTDCSQSGLLNICDPNPGYIPVNPEYHVTVAIIDTGVEDNNPSFTHAIWQNPEVSDIDNCKLNDQIGYDFINEDGSVEDTDGHGTGVNAVVACDFKDDVDLNLMNLKFYENDRSTLFDAVCAIYYAIENGAAVINISWGFITEDEIPSILSDAIDFARVKDVLMITSAGNRALDNDVINKYPANYQIDNMISVAAYEQSDMGSDPKLASYSNYGDLSVDIAALGQSQVPTVGGGSDILAGTSLAAPVVAKTAAEIRARYPMLSAAEVKTCIINSVDQYPSFSESIESGGVLNHLAALDCAFNNALLKCNDDAVVIAQDHQIDSLVWSQMSISSDKKVNYPLEVMYKAKNFISLSNNFEVDAGAQFLAEIEDCKTVIQPGQ